MTSADTHQPEQGHPIALCSTRVRAELGAVSASPAWSMTPDEQRETLVELTRVQAQVAELRHRVLAGGDHNDIGKVNGSSSTAAWLSHETKQTRKQANADVRTAQALDTAFEATRVALAEGRINEDQATVIIAAVTDLPDTVSAVDRGRGEAHLIGEAADHDALALRKLGNHLLEVLAPDENERRLGEKLKKQEDEARRKASFSMWDNGDGSYSGKFRLPTLHAEALMKMLQALTAPRKTGPGGRTDAAGNKILYPELLGRGLMQLIERIPSDCLPRCGGNNATIVVTASLDALRSGLGAASLDTGGEISIPETRRLCCEGGIIPMVLGGDSMPLDVGREQRFHNRYQRVAMAHRDGGCTAENCDRPAAWCEGHHEIPWSEGGETSVEDGRMLCPWHHHLAHDPGYDMRRLANGQVRFSRRQ